MTSATRRKSCCSSADGRDVRYRLTPRNRGAPRALRERRACRRGAVRFGSVRREGDHTPARADATRKGSSCAGAAVILVALAVVSAVWPKAIAWPHGRRSALVRDGIPVAGHGANRATTRTGPRNARLNLSIGEPGMPLIALGLVATFGRDHDEPGSRRGQSIGSRRSSSSKFRRTARHWLTRFNAPTRRKIRFRHEIWLTDADGRGARPCAVASDDCTGPKIRSGRQALGLPVRRGWAAAAVG
jgi:hypothetical protein